MDTNQACRFAEACGSHKPGRYLKFSVLIQKFVILCVTISIVRAAPPLTDNVSGVNEVVAHSVRQAVLPLVQPRNFFGTLLPKLGNVVKAKSAEASGGALVLSAPSAKPYAGNMIRKEMTKREIRETAASKPASLQSIKEVAVQPSGITVQTQGSQQAGKLEQRVFRHEFANTSRSAERNLVWNVDRVGIDIPVSRARHSVRTAKRAESTSLEVPASPITKPELVNKPSVESPTHQERPSNTGLDSLRLFLRKVVFSQDPTAPAVEPVQPMLSDVPQPPPPPKAVPATVTDTVTATPKSPPTVTSAPSRREDVAVAQAPVVVQHQEDTTPSLLIAFLCGCVVTCGGIYLLWCMRTTFTGNSTGLPETQSAELDSSPSQPEMYHRRTSNVNVLGTAVVTENTDGDNVSSCGAWQRAVSVSDL